MRECLKCLLSDKMPDVQLDEKGVCNYCNNHKEYSSQSKEIIGEDTLIEALDTWKSKGEKYDVLVPVSGGVDSCYTLITIVEKFGLHPLAFHNDHGYENPGATENVKKLCKELDVDLIVVQQDLTFMKKMWKYVNESSDVKLNSCYVCGNILYLNAIELANRYGIKLIFNGYSKGQVLLNSDKRRAIQLLQSIQSLTIRSHDKEFKDIFMKKLEYAEKVISYNSIEDLYYNDHKDKITIVPFYVFDCYKTDKNYAKEQIRKVFDWQPISDSYPKRTTNCLMNWLNSYVDSKKLGYNVYDFEYSELVRKGEMTREQAEWDLELNPPEGIIEKLAQDINLDLSIFDTLDMK